MKRVSTTKATSTKHKLKWSVKRHVCVIGEKVKWLCSTFALWLDTQRTIWSVVKYSRYHFTTLQSPATCLAPPLHKDIVTNRSRRYWLPKLCLHYSKCQLTKLMHGCWYEIQVLYNMLLMDCMGNPYEYICPHKWDSFLSFNGIPSSADSLVLTVWPVCHSL